MKYVTGTAIAIILAAFVAFLFMMDNTPQQKARAAYNAAMNLCEDDTVTYRVMAENETLTYAFSCEQAK